MTQRPQRLHLRHLLVSTQAGSNDDLASIYSSENSDEVSTQAGSNDDAGVVGVKAYVNAVSTQAGSNDDMSMPIHCLPNVCAFQRKHAQAMTEAMTFPSFTS